MSTPGDWLPLFPIPRPEQHKYDRGHAAVIGGGMAMTGAAKLAARVALRLCGLVTILCPSGALPVYAGALLSVMAKPLDGAESLPSWMKERKVRAILIGPGNGVEERTRAMVLAALEETDAACVLDADALSVFSGDQNILFSSIRNRRAPVVLTPHAGEFVRLFGQMGDDRTKAVRDTAEESGAVVMLKGADTVISSPDGRAAVNSNAPPWLAAAGSGDVLAGILTGLLAAGMPAFEAACAAAWIHGECAYLLGPGLLAEELDGKIPAVLRIHSIIRQGTTLS